MIKQAVNSGEMKRPILAKSEVESLDAVKKIEGTVTIIDSDTVPPSGTAVLRIDGQPTP